MWLEFHTLRLSDLVAAVHAWGWGSVLAAIALSAASFLLIGCVEWLGLRWAGAKVPLGAALTGSFVASAIAHSLGSGLLVAGAIRARWYGRRGVGLGQVAAATLFQGFSFVTGLSTVAGIALVAAGRHDIAAPLTDGLGLTLLTFVGGYLVLCGLLRRPLRGFGRSIRLPTLGAAIGQVGLGALDNSAAAAIIWSLLPDGAISYPAFVTGYAPSVVAGSISHVPGGAGVFETSVTTLLPGLPAAALAAAFLGYRLFFYLLPLAAAGVILATTSLRERR